MRKAFLLGAAFALALGFQSAKADVRTDIDVDKTVKIDIAELIAKLKLVAIVVIVRDEPEMFAESQTVFNQLQQFNRACTNCDEKVDSLVNSGNRNNGILSLNQANGNSINQGTAISVAFVNSSGNFGNEGQAVIAVVGDDPQEPPDTPTPGASAFAESQVNGDQDIVENTVKTVNVLFRTARIRGSINGNTGIAAFNQGTGNILNQQNAISIAAAVADGVALSDATLGQNVANNTVNEAVIRKDALVAGSMNRNQGIVQGNQSVGNLGNQANVVSISAVGIGGNGR